LWGRLWGFCEDRWVVGDEVFGEVGDILVGLEMTFFGEFVMGFFLFMGMLLDG
jgi:hypothetical protein